MVTGSGLRSILAVVMAKRPVAGQVKTRLVDGGLDPSVAAAVARTMLECTVRRLAARMPLVVALTGDGPRELPAWGQSSTLEQGGGDLGCRIDRVWKTVGPNRPVAFFGADSPDMPAGAIAALPLGLAAAPIALGPSFDGGYWTLAARAHQPAVLADIDWGTDTVYDQTWARAERVGASVCRLPTWHDVDRPEDLAHLRRRLSAGRGRSEVPLEHMAAQLETLLARPHHDGI